MYPKHVGHENGGCGHLGRAPLSRPTFGGHSCKKDCMVAPHESRLIGEGKFECVQRRKSRRSQFSTPHTRHHSARARIAPRTPPTAPDHSPHTPDAFPTGRFEPPSRSTAGSAQNPALAGPSADSGRVRPTPSLLCSTT